MFVVLEVAEKQETWDNDSCEKIEVHLFLLISYLYCVGFPTLHILLCTM
jgi:hypothetical protein